MLCAGEPKTVLCPISNTVSREYARHVTGAMQLGGFMEKHLHMAGGQVCLTAA